jgi:hypothetical protein
MPLAIDLDAEFQRERAPFRILDLHIQRAHGFHHAWAEIIVDIGLPAHRLQLRHPHSDEMVPKGCRILAAEHQHALAARGFPVIDAHLHEIIRPQHFQSFHLGNRVAADEDRASVDLATNEGAIVGAIHTSDAVCEIQRQHVDQPLPAKIIGRVNPPQVQHRDDGQINHHTIHFRHGQFRRDHRRLGAAALRADFRRRLDPWLAWIMRRHDHFGLRLRFLQYGEALHGGQSGCRHMRAFPLAAGAFTFREGNFLVIQRRLDGHAPLGALVIDNTGNDIALQRYLHRIDKIQAPPPPDQRRVEGLL